MSIHFRFPEDDPPPVIRALCSSAPDILVRADAVGAPARQPESLLCERPVGRVEERRDAGQAGHAGGALEPDGGVEAAKHFDSLDDRAVGKAPVDPSHERLPAHSDRARVETRRSDVREALKTGNDSDFSSLLLGLYLGGRSLAELADKLLRPAFEFLGTSWAHGQIEVYQERRAVELVRKALHELSRVVPVPAAEAPVALTAALAGDPYVLPVAIAELVLRDVGWNATSLGIGNPEASLRAAIDDLSPRLLCVGASAIDDVSAFTTDVNALYERARSRGTALAIGGRALTRELRERIRYSAYCDSMSALVGFAESLWARDG